MALQELSSAFYKASRRQLRSSMAIATRNSRRHASDEATARDSVQAVEDFEDLESQSSFSPSDVSAEMIEAFDPVKRAQGRRKELPASRYQFRPPRYYRGPLHPHQPPPASDPSSRTFVPGPFSYTRLEQTYQSTIAPDLMTLGYVHKPPGTITTPRADRLRTWDESSPYHKGRPKRGPRGPGEVLRVVEKDINWRNVPKIEAVVVHTMTRDAQESSAYLHVAGIMLQAITGARPTVHRVKHPVAQWNLRVKNPISLTSTIRGDQAYDFVDKCISLVLPRIKDWEGVRGTTGDGAGNLSFGFDREGAILFPEVAVNYDMYPPKMIPGFHVTIQTSATSDRHARLLLKALGVPFYGRLVD